MVVFLRRTAKKFSKFGKKRKKLLTWRKPKGRDNKMREKRRGYASSVSIGYGTRTKREFVLINNVKDLDKIGKDQIGFVGKVGKKKRIEILTKAKTMKVKLQNFNAESFLKKNTPNKAVLKEDVPSKENEKDKKIIMKRTGTKNELKK